VEVEPIVSVMAERRPIFVNKASRGFFVGASWIADELLGQHALGKDDIPVAAELPKRNSSEESDPGTACEHPADESEVAAPEEPDSLLLDRAIGMIWSVMNKGRP
jgi:hypothetical protein